MIVVDASVVLELLLNTEVGAAVADRLLDPTEALAEALDAPLWTRDAWLAAAGGHDAAVECV